MMLILIRCVFGALLATFTTDVIAQKDSCVWYVQTTKRFGGSKLKKSIGAMRLMMPGSASGELRFSNLALPNTLEMSLQFTNEKIPFELGDLLRISFVNGTFQEVIPRMKKSTGLTSYVLLQSRGKGPQAMSSDDKALLQQLKTVNISSIKLNIGDKSKEILFTAPRADTIRHIINCLLRPN